MNGNLLLKEPNELRNPVNLIHEVGDLNTPTGNLESSLIMGLDKSLFQSHNTKTNFLIIQDSHLKLLPFNPDFKTQPSFSLSLVNESGNETFIEKPEVKKNESKEGSNESVTHEIKNALIYNEKANKNVILDDLSSESKSCVSKLRQNVQNEGIVGMNNTKNFQLIINYIPNIYTVNQKRGLENSEILDCNNANNGNENIFKTLLLENDQSNHCFKADFKISTKKTLEILGKNFTKEKHLPFMKKINMKKMICLGKERSLLKEDLIKNTQPQDQIFIENNAQELHLTFEEHGVNASEKSLFSKNEKQKNQKIPPKLKKMTCTASNEKNFQLLKSEKDSMNNDLSGFDITKFKNMHDLVEGLRKYRMISVPIWQILNAGLEEMNVDLLKEIINKMKKPKGGKYSPQLKAFALILYFKQPGTFNFLATICKNGWPSLNIIKEWKQQLNSLQRPDFVGIEKKTENNVS